MVVPSFGNILDQGVAEIIVKDETLGLMRSGKKLRLKEGFDPSSPDIHLGHMVTLRKLRQFQELGHQVVLIVGDWTAQIGDPSGVSVTRPVLSREQVQANAETYMQQFFKIVDKGKTEVRWQSEWFGKFDLRDVIQLTSKFTVAQMLAREDFSRRYNDGQPISITELLYPLLQGYDSVAIQADIEFGGIDQKFNLLVGREMQVTAGQRPQQILMMPLLVGTDGTHKMSKSLGNYIGVTELPQEIYGKIMSIPDELITQYFQLVTDISEEELGSFRKELASGTINPMILKKRLAREIVGQLYDDGAVGEAEEYFGRTVQNKEIPEEIKECWLSFSRIAAPPAGDAPDGWDISRMIVETEQAKSRSEANRLISQGAVTIDGEKISRNINIIKSGSIIKVGKRRFAKVIDTDK
ncbi:tyrosine--tRNA ligase [Chloroflexota bacterium]